MPQEAEEWVVEHPEAGLQEEVVEDLQSSIPLLWMTLVPMMTMTIYLRISSQEEKNEGEEEEDEEDEEDEDEVQVLTLSGKSTSKGLVPFNPEIHDITGYEKADIIKLRNAAFKGNAKYAKKRKGVLLGLPSSSIPTIQQINSSELFAFRAPQRGKSENHDDDKEGPPKEADIHHLWLPFLQGNKALGNCPPFTI